MSHNVFVSFQLCVGITYPFIIYRRLHHTPLSTTRYIPRFVKFVKRTSGDSKDLHSTRTLTHNPSPFHSYHLLSTNKMGNKNNRVPPAARTPALNSISLPPQTPSQPPQCTDPHCEVKASHDDTTYIPSQPDLPVYVQAKHTTLEDSLANKNFIKARLARDWLLDFYTLHGLSTGIASHGLPDVPPPPPKRCTDSECPVTQFHLEGVFNLWADELPDMISNGPSRLHNALQHGNYEHALSIHAFMTRFWRMHGDVDGSIGSFDAAGDADDVHG